MTFMEFFHSDLALITVPIAALLFGAVGVTSVVDRDYRNRNRDSD